MEFMPLLCWLAACFALAMTARAVFHLRRLRFADGAFTFYLGLGMAACFAPVWFVCSATGLIFNSFTVFFGTLSCMTLSLFYRYKKGYFYVDEAGEMDKDRGHERKKFLFGFALFAGLFILAVYIKGYKPLIDHQTEQYMDFGFMNAMYRQQKLPFEDIWAANEHVNYYYLGQALSVFMCRLSFIGPDRGYNYMLCTLFAGLFMTVFGMVQAFLNSFNGMKKGLSVCGGTVSALLASCGGNGHFLVYGIFKLIYRKHILHDPDYSYWFPSSTLFIGYEPETLDKAKHEFPSYTLILGDLHAHVCNMIFVTVLLIILLDYILIRDEKWENGRKFLSQHIILMGLLLGLFKGTNFWDFPIYFVICGAVILFTDLKKYGCSLRTAIHVLLKGLIIYISGAVLMLPFTLAYRNPASGIHLCDRHSPMDKLMIIWFPFFISSAFVLIYSLTVSAKKRNVKVDHTGGNELQLLAITAITLCGLGLIFVPEVVYVKDIYGDVYERYNTMFKLTFQAFILLSVVTGTGIGLLLKERNRVYRIGAGLMICLSVMLTAYMPVSVKAWFGNVLKTDLRQGISATGFIERDPSYDDIKEPIKVLNNDRRRKLHIIEEAGTSYTPENRLSVFTGVVTVSGWYVHEWVWRNDPDDVNMRHNEVRYFYESGDREFCSAIAHKYDLDYIYVGEKAKDRYDVVYAGFEDLGEKVWENSAEGWMLIKVNK